jgi:hypothetical protein
MQVEELIEKLVKLAEEHPGVKVYAYSGVEAEPCEPEPEYRDWGNPNDPDKGIYL